MYFEFSGLIMLKCITWIFCLKQVFNYFLLLFELRSIFILQKFLEFSFNVLINFHFQDSFVIAFSSESVCNNYIINYFIIIFFNLDFSDIMKKVEHFKPLNLQAAGEVLIKSTTNKIKKILIFNQF